jgi:hypothetical protein
MKRDKRMSLYNILENKQIKKEKSRKEILELKSPKIDFI